MKPWPWIVGAVIVTMVIIVGVRLEQAGLAVVVGVLCGILAGLPMSIALLYMLQRERQERQRLEERRYGSEERQLAAPPVLILNSGRGGDSLPNNRFMLGEQRRREFTIIGEEEER